MAVFIDVQLNRHQVRQGVSELARCQLVANPSTLSFADYEAATAKAGQMIRQVRLAGLDLDPGGTGWSG